MKTGYQFLVLMTLLLYSNINVFGQSCTTYPSPLITTEFSSHCEERREQAARNNPEQPEECLLACEFMEIVYSTQYVTNHTYQWTVFGGTFVVNNANGNEITVTWGPAGPGIIQVVETDVTNPSNPCATAAEICVDILESPTSAFTSIPAAVSGLITICMGDEVNFYDNTNPADEVIAWEWTVTDLNSGVSVVFSNDEDPSYLFSNSGDYLVTLTVYNECGCSDTSEVKVKVLDSEAPIIACISTVCAKEEATYSVTNACPGATYFWTIVNGTGSFASGSGPTDPSPTIIWDNPQNGQGILEVLVTGCNNSCPVPTQVIIPVFTPNLGGITGPLLVCVDETVQYSLPPQPNNTFNWLITRIPSGINYSVVSDFGSMIEVFWTQPGTYSIKVQPQFGDMRCDFEYPIFDIVVEVRLPFDMTPNSQTVCSNDMVSYNLSPTPSGTVIWEAYDQFGALVTTLPGSSFSASLLGPGVYEIRANDSGSEFCNPYASSLLTVDAAAPALSGGITGPQDVCDGSSHTYSATPDFGHFLEWTVSSGSTINGGGTTAIGDDVTVTFGGGGSYTVSVVQVPIAPPSCPSTSVPLMVNEITPVTPTIMMNTTIPSPATVCADVTNNFAVPPPLGASMYEWTISPAALGTVVSGQYSPSADIQFHTHTSLNTATVTLSTTICNTVVTSTYDITISDPSITITAPAIGCVNDLISFTGNPSVGGSVNWAWDFGDSQTDTGNPGQNTYGNAGSYGVTATATFTTGVCAGVTVSGNHQINIKPEPSVFISGTNGLVLCPANGVFNTTLVASVTALPGSPGPFTYSWSTGAMGVTSITVSSSGTYTLSVTDTSTGCTNDYDVRVTNCSIAPPCPAPPGSFDFTVVENCDELTFTENISVPFTSVSWDFGDGNGGSGNTASNVYNNSGFYVVTMYITLPGGQVCSYTEQVTVEFIPDFIWEFECVGGTQLQLNLIDQTDYISTIPYGNFSFAWNIPGGPNQVGPMPSVVLPGGITYNITLTVTLGGIPCDITIPVDVPNAASATIIHDAPACVDQAINFSTPAPPGSDLLWNFGDMTTSVINSPSKAFNTSGVKTIFLTETDEWGCTATSSATVVVYPNTLAVSIDPTVPTCANTALNLVGNVIGANTSFNWQFENNGGSTFGSGAVPATNGTVNSSAITASGDYVLTVTDLRGCVAQSPVESVVIVPIPPAPIVGLDGYCEGDDITLATVPGFASYAWSGTDPNGNPLSTGATDIYNTFNVIDGTYNFSLTVDNGTCTNTSLFTTTVHENPNNVAIAGPYPSCVPVNLTASAAAVPAVTSYIWSNGDSGTGTTATVGGQIEVIAYTAEGCSASDVHTISEGPNLEDLAVGCYCFPNATTWHGPEGPGYQYQWFFNGNPISGATGQDYTFDFISNGGMGAGIYNLEVTNSSGCSTYSDDIIIDLGEVCDKCKFEVDLKDIKCIGYDAINGGFEYTLTLSVTNYYMSLAGFAGNSSQGFVHNGTMTPSTIPGSGANTTVTVNFTLFNGQSTAIINFLGAGTNGLSCEFKIFIEKFPSCDHGEPCNLKFFDAKVECLYTYFGNSYYSYELPISNLGNTVTNLTFVPCTPGVSITSSTTTLPNSLSTIVSGNIIAPNGVTSICVTVYGYDPITGKKCEWKITIKLPKCDEIAYGCTSTMQSVKIKCANPAVDPFGNGNYIIDVVISSQVSNGNLIIKPTTTMPENMVSMISSTVSGNIYTASFLVVDVPGNNDPLCFGVFIHSGHDVCVTKFCAKKPDCKTTGRSADLGDLLDTPSGFDAGASMKISPNPASTAVQVKYDLSTTGMTEVRMMRVDGKLVQHLRGLNQQDQISLDVSQLSPGLYTILLLQNGELKAAEKVVVSGQQ